MSLAGHLNLNKLNNETVIIRSHGVGPSCYNTLKCKHLGLVDATCPFVRRNQEITKKLVADGKQVVLIGEKKHPEMKSVSEWAVGKSFIVETMEDVDKLPHFEEAHVVIQTTFSVALADELIEAISRKSDKISVHKTICAATSERQQAARELAKQMDVMIVVGGKNSANTGRLAEVCRNEGAITYHIETAKELRKEWFKSHYKVGITAGASTPDWIIEEVFFIMEDMNEMLAMEDINLDVHKGSVVEGTVVDLSDDKAYISFGYKTEAVLPAHEYSYPAPASLKDVLKVGDTIRVQVVSGVKEDSTIFVSKIKVDRLADWDVIEDAYNKGEPVECEGIEAIKV
ncbi:MAG: 4-hydroxy-3-methylbut-2-enyl diphosphate reductase, partial [Dialister micraerophilus]|nr:4-hydroxy-3-methylbut-2-enyl diphosphate reductase [Dialister micraerophilus]